MAHKKGIPTGMPFYVGDSNDIVHLAAVRQWRSRKGHKIGYFAKQNRRAKHAKSPMAHKKGIPTGMPFYVGDSNDIVHLAAVRQWRSRKGHKIGYFAKQNCVKKENYLIIISD